MSGKRTSVKFLLVVLTFWSLAVLVNSNCCSSRSTCCSSGSSCCSSGSNCCAVKSNCCSSGSNCCSAGSGCTTKCCDQTQTTNCCNVQCTSPNQENCCRPPPSPSSTTSPVGPVPGVSTSIPDRLTDTEEGATSLIINNISHTIHNENVVQTGLNLTFSNEAHININVDSGGYGGGDSGSGVGGGGGGSGDGDGQIIIRPHPTQPPSIPTGYPDPIPDGYPSPIPNGYPIPIPIPIPTGYPTIIPTVHPNIIPTPIPFPLPHPYSQCCTVLQPCYLNICRRHACGQFCTHPYVFRPVNPCPSRGCYARSYWSKYSCDQGSGCGHVQHDCSSCDPRSFYRDYQTYSSCYGCFY